jgi:hypothetical protein
MPAGKRFRVAPESTNASMVWIELFVYFDHDGHFWLMNPCITVCSFVINRQRLKGFGNYWHRGEKTLSTGGIYVIVAFVICCSLRMFVTSVIVVPEAITCRISPTKAIYLSLYFANCCTSCWFIPPRIIAYRGKQLLKSLRVSFGVSQQGGQWYPVPVDLE